MSIRHFNSGATFGYPSPYACSDGTSLLRKTAGGQGVRGGGLYCLVQQLAISLTRVTRVNRR